jgi:hypothetical protein
MIDSTFYQLCAFFRGSSGKLQANTETEGNLVRPVSTGVISTTQQSPAIKVPVPFGQLKEDCPQQVPVDLNAFGALDTRRIEKRGKIFGISTIQ